MNNKLTKLVSVLCALVLLLATYASAAEKVYNDNLDLPQAGTLKMENGTIVFEAEDMVYEKTMLLQNDKEASGGKVLRAWGKYTPQADRPQAEPNEPADIYMEFISDTSDPVYLWMRLKLPNSGSNSFFYKLNNSSYIAKHPTEGPDYQWVYISSFEILEAGMSAKLNIQYREPNVLFDKILITTDMDFTPVEINDVPTGEGKDYSGLYPTPYITPPAGHPRVMFTKEDIPGILKNIEHPDMKEIYELTAKEADEKLDAKLDKTLKRNYNPSFLPKITNRALFYALGLRDKTHGRETVQNALDYLETVRFDISLGDETRVIGQTMMMGAVVYDWCYDLLTDEEKAFIIKRMKILAKQTEVGYPPTGGQSIFGHASEGEVFAYPFICGIATYDEDPEMYNLSAGRILSEMAPARVMWNKTGAHSLGYSYGVTRFDWETMSNLVFAGMGAENVLGEDEDFAEVSKWFMYSRLPNGASVKIADDYVWPARTPRTWWPTPSTSFAFASAITDDPYVKQASMVEKFVSGYATTYKSVVPDILLANPEIEGKHLDTLPLARRTTYPLSSIQARTNWTLGMDSNAAIAYFEAREKQYSDHAHADLGTFQIYYKGYLAINGGSYGGTTGGWGTNHFKNYSIRTISHNGMTVFDNNETTWGSTLANDGGQKLSEDIYLLEEYMAKEDEAKTEAWYIGPNEETPEFSFIKTNLTNAYGGGKVTNHERSMVFMDLNNDDYPAAVVVFDDITSSNKAFSKKWIMNMVFEPEISGDTITVIRNDNGYNGKLVNKTLLPAEHSITAVGGEGKESFVNGVNYPNADRPNTDSEQGSWRVEVSPSGKKTRDLFLNSMYVTDYDRELPQLPMYKEETSSLSGVTIMDRCVYFSKEKQIKSAQTIEIRNNGYEEMKCLVTDIAPGLWKVTSSDGSFKTYMVEEDKNSLYFRAKPGNVTISKLSSGEPDYVQYEQMSKPKYGDFLVYNPDEILFNTLSAPTVIKNGKMLVPAKSLFETYGAETAETNGGVNAKISSETYVINNGNPYAYVNGKGILLSYVPEIINGCLYVCPEDLPCFTVSYDKAAKILSIRLKKFENYGKEGISSYIVPVKITTSYGSDKGKENLCDGNFSSLWKTEGIGRYATLELDSVSSLGKVIIAFSEDNALSSFYEIEVSTDGYTYKKVASGSTNERLHTIELPIGTNAKYIRFKGNGSMHGRQNHIGEIILVRGGE